MQVTYGTILSWAFVPAPLSFVLAPAWRTMVLIALWGKRRGKIYCEERETSLLSKALPKNTWDILQAERFTKLRRPGLFGERWRQKRDIETPQEKRRDLFTKLHLFFFFEGTKKGSPSFSLPVFIFSLAALKISVGTKEGDERHNRIRNRTIGLLYSLCVVDRWHTFPLFLPPKSKADWRSMPTWQGEDKIQSNQDIQNRLSCFSSEEFALILNQIKITQKQKLAILSFLLVMLPLWVFRSSGVR